MDQKSARGEGAPNYSLSKNTNFWFLFNSFTHFTHTFSHSFISMMVGQILCEFRVDKALHKLLLLLGEVSLRRGEGGTVGTVGFLMLRLR